jgi:hypothetical protein
MRWEDIGALMHISGRTAQRIEMKTSHDLAVKMGLN